MKKDDFKKSIDNINPDAYMGNRLKAKITTVNIPVKRNKQVTLSITAFCLAFAIIFGVGFLVPSKTSKPQQNTTENTVPQNKTVNAFIMVASAANTENAENTESTEKTTVIKALELNEEVCMYGVYLEVCGISGLSDLEIEKIENEFNDIFDEYCAKNNFDRGRAQISVQDNVILNLCLFDEFVLDLEDVENVKSINVKNTSRYSEMVHSYYKPGFYVPEHGNDFNVYTEDYGFEEYCFYWEHTEEMGKAFDENINTPFSTFNDTITFTVEYKDGSKAIGVVDLVFDDNGNATAVCKNYDYIA